MSNLFETLSWRGLVYDATRDAESYLAETAQPVGYVGFDPTARSLHIGSLVQIMALVHLQRSGGRPIGVLGGGTGMIGDPSGRTSERAFLSTDDLAANMAGIRAQLEKFLDFDGARGAELINNLDWLGAVGLMDFLRDIGKHYTVNQMLAKESVKLRLDRAREGAEGISYTEFTYMLMQAYDFLELFDRRACRFQMGGSDQWGNITAGIDLIGRLRGEQAYGLVTPLVTSSSGLKFGKSEGSNIWLDAEMTSPYRFYQYWINSVDADVDKYLKYFTLLEHERIVEITSEHQRAPEKRAGQAALAEDLTLRVHGTEGLARAQSASKALFGGDLAAISASDLADVFGDAPSIRLEDRVDSTAALTIAEVCAASGLAKSRGEARRLIAGGGVYLNNVRVEDAQRAVSRSDRLHDRYLVLRRGAKTYILVDWTD